MRWFGKKLDYTAEALEEARAASGEHATTVASPKTSAKASPKSSSTTVTIQSGTQVTVGPDGSVSFSGPDTAKLMEAVKQATLGPTAPDTDLSKAIAGIAAKFQGRAPEEAVPALKVALKTHGHDVPDEWVTLIAQTISKGGTTNLSFGNWSSTPQ
jgi:hypothetical protein